MIFVKPAEDLDQEDGDGDGAEDKDLSVEVSKEPFLCGCNEAFHPVLQAPPANKLNYHKYTQK